MMRLMVDTAWMSTMLMAIMAATTMAMMMMAMTIVLYGATLMYAEPAAQS